jgi:hypothetical protein
MTLPYLVRLVCISLAAFFLVHLAAGAVIAAGAPLISRFAGRMRAAAAARTLFALRMLPAGAALFAVLALCVPSFLRFETEAGAEEVGWVCIIAAGLGASIWGISLVRGLRATGRSMRYVSQCRRAAQRISIPHEPAPVWMLDREEPFLMLAGLLRPRLLISRSVVENLTPEQLAAALEHERAHWTGRDNLKRLLTLLVPGLLPGLSGFRRLEKSWARFIEWTADDRAVHGDSHISVSLADALVRVARMGVSAPPEPLVTSLLADARELSARVDRLLGASRESDFAPRWSVLSLGLAAAGAFLALQPSTLMAVHRVLEVLVR